MNRLVIVGNGFDLAHKLPTSYSHFIDWYWTNIIESLKKSETLDYKDNFVGIELLFKERNSHVVKNRLNEVESYSDLKTLIFDYSEAFPSTRPAHLYDRCKLEFYNSFFETICGKRHIQNWVDIENEYFTILKDCLLPESDRKFKMSVIDLNEDFNHVRILFERYLEENICNKYKFSPVASLNRFFNISSRGYEDFLKEFHFEEKVEFDEFKTYVQNIKDHHKSPKVLKRQELSMQNLFLNFNYTPTVDSYIQNFQSDYYDYYGDSFQVQIHGKIGQKDETINFGFGDEMDEDYRNIENKNDNEYLKFIKSFQYFQNSNYKKILEFINEKNFQVYIMGHSCGLSDRTLLNTIFEHPYCKSIKIFYHKFKSPNNIGQVDNYTEIVQNISRHFNDKQLLRRRVVEKNLCEEFPQVELPLK